MDNQLRVALIAIRMAPGPHTGDPQAVVIGTMDAWKQELGDGSTTDWKDGEDWRYACYPLSVLRDLIANYSISLDPKPAIFIGLDVLEKIKDSSNGRLTKTDSDGLGELGFKKTYLDTDLKVNIGASTELELKRRQTAIPLRDVERVFFFAHDAWSSEKSPFAAFDCARVLDPNDPDTQPHSFEAGIPKKERHTGSRLILFPDFTDSSRQGALAAFSAHLEIKVAINGHNLNGSNANVAPDRFDTRMLLDIGVRGEKGKNLWLTDGQGKPRGLRFDKMRLSCSLAPNILGGARWRSDPVELIGFDLLELARDSSTSRYKVDRWGTQDSVNHVPALAALQFSERLIYVRREFGFRALGLKRNGATDNDIVKIGWRFELWVYGFSNTFLKHPVVAAVVPSGVEKALQDTLVLFAEEQRRDDIVLDLRDLRSSRTILTARLHTGDGVTDQDNAITGAALEALNGCIKTVHDGLKIARDGRPISLLPELEVSNVGVPWHVVGAVIDEAPGVLGVLDVKRRLQVWLTTFEPRMRFNMWAGVSTTPGVNVGSLSAEATFARLETTDRAYPRYMVDLHAQKTNMSGGFEPTARPAFQPLITTEDPASVVPGMRLGLEIKKYLGIVSARGDKVEPRQASGAIVMIGALQLVLGKAFDAEVTADTAGRIIFRPLAAERDADPDQLSASIDALVKLPITSVEPAGEDDPQQSVRTSPRERRLPGANEELPDPDAPLLLPLDGPRSSKDGGAALTLSGEEAVTRDQDHAIGLSIQSVRAGGGAQSADTEPHRQRLLVIEPRPFRIAAIDFAKLESLATAESSEVAVWNASGEGGLSWRVRDEGQVVDLVLPPQVIGEAMEKNRSGLPGRPKDIEPAKPAAARFGSLTVIKVDPTYANTTFREPGWNLRRILGFALQRSPGARLLDLRMELLYGLIARLRVDDVWLTEISGAVGEPARPLTDTPTQLHLQKHFRLVNAVLEAEKRRIAVEKLWRSRPDDELQLNEGVSFQIRRRVLENNELVGGPVTPLRWPVPGIVPDDPGGLIDKSILDATFAANDRDEDSFPGGLSWAFESANILMSVYGRPHSSEGGSARGVHLSALGGYGSQRALFDNRKSIVESDTAQGRVQRYRLQRIGRIACLWHPAKHVIVYERTVVPPAQFYNRPPIGLRQDEHLGRAILRKVEEYIEILKPQRRYPEDGTSLRECGFVLGAEFKSLKIHVDSAWGSDVRSEGWQVPLWDTRFIGLAPNPNDPDDPANIYPKPQVRIIFAGEGGREFPQEIDEPEKLYFYSSVVEGEDEDTDSWKPVRDVDFCDLPSPVVARVRSESADLTDAVLPPEPAHVPGFERFTLALVPTMDAVAITQGRVPGGPVAALRNVTIARSSAQDDGGNEAAGFGRELAAKAANVRAEIDRRVGQVLGELEKLDRDTNQT